MRHFLHGSSEITGLVSHLCEMVYSSAAPQLRLAPRSGEGWGCSETDQCAGFWFQQGGESDGFSHSEGQPQRLPQTLEVRQQPARKVTLTKGALQQPQHPPMGTHVHT